VFFNRDAQLVERESVARSGTLPVIYETGQIRPGGLNGGAYGRRLNVLGTYFGACSVKIEMAFDDAPAFSTTKIKTWTLTDADYASGGSVVLELTLPVQKFFAARFRITVTRAAGVTVDAFHAHGMTMFFDSEGEGPRVGAGSKG
jgi:hypothetical protein